MPNSIATEPLIIRRSAFVASMDDQGEDHSPCGVPNPRAWSDARLSVSHQAVASDLLL